MKKTNSLTIIFLSLLLLNSCSTLVEGLGGSKKKGSDEFMVEKKAPLVLPPKFGELPEPGKNIDRNLTLTENLSIEMMMKKNSSIEASKEKNTSNSPIEKSIIEKINE
tara:strand:+ start:429 stop:752 length:324 start_codon:yes stop_codon:yes gene_type:complete